jgi:hypothetical protein
MFLVNSKITTTMIFALVFKKFRVLLFLDLKQHYSWSQTYQLKLSYLRKKNSEYFKPTISC